MRILTADQDLNTPTTVLLAKADMLSVHQLSFVATANVVRRALETGRPCWLSDLLRPLPPSRTSRGCLAPQPFKSNLRGEALSTKAIRVYNSIPLDIREFPIKLFKAKVKIWARDNVPPKPP